VNPSVEEMLAKLGLMPTENPGNGASEASSDAV